MVNKSVYRRIYCMLAMLGYLTILPGQQSTITYTPTSAEISNPERGWYDDYYSYSGGAVMGITFRPLDSLEIRKQREDDNITLILRLFYLHEFLEMEDLSQDYLLKMQADFDAIRSAGVKCILRFAYSASQSAEVWDATPEKVFSHIESLGEVLMENGDIIAGVQAGFIGAWGEWYYTKNFAGQGYIPDETDQLNRRILVEKLLAILPDHVSVQGRTPAIIKNLVQTDDPISEEEAFSGTIKSRVGHHNDCFLADNSDYGTYTNLENDLAYLHETTKYTIAGGETCDASRTTSDCVNSVPRMAELHWTYLNRDYNKDVYDKWIDQGCYEEVNISLGYRIRLENATIDNMAEPGSSANVSFTFQNVGYAAPTQFKPIQIVLTNTSSLESTILDYNGTNIDIRYWEPGEIQTSGTIDIPADIPEGNYTMGIQFPDKDSILRSKTAYSIQLANAGIWDQKNGVNNLNHMLIIGEGGEGAFPTKPSELEATTISESQINLAWTDNSSDETGFEIMRSVGDFMAWEIVDTTNADTETYNDLNLKKGTFYNYIIRSLNQYGFSNWSEIISVPTMGVNVITDRAPILNIFPNPLNGSSLTMIFEDDSEKVITVSNILGVKLFEKKIAQSNYIMDPGVFSPGLYIITLGKNHIRAHKNLLVL